VANLKGIEMSFSFKTQKAVAPYRLWLGVGHNRYLLHGQATPGKNNGVPVKSVAEAKRIAAEWRKSGIRPPYDCL
jgi:hypothetical protein